MIACSALKIDCVTDQNVEAPCTTPGPLRKAKNYTKFNVVLNVLNKLYFYKMCDRPFEDNKLNFQKN